MANNNFISGYQAFKGAKTSPLAIGSNSLMQPVQFLPDKDKTLAFTMSVMNYIESQGQMQLQRNLNWMSKNYNLANNVIDKTDYVRDAENEYAQLIDHMSRQGETAMEIKSYLFTKLVVDILTNEYSKRSSSIMFKCNDERTYNEMVTEKGAEVEQSLLQQITIRQANKMMEMGLSPESEQGQQMMDPSTIKSLPAIQEYYTKDYKSMYQQWAEIQKKNDDDRFYMREQERLAFRDSLIVDRAFWEFQMFDNDYRLRKRNPKQVFYRKSPNERWVSNGQWAGIVDKMTIADVVDNYGHMMTDEQLVSLNILFPLQGVGYALDGKSPDQYYDSTQSWEWNRTGPGLGLRQYMAMKAIQPFGNSTTNFFGGDITNALFADDEDMIDANTNMYVRVCTMYWKTQRKVGALTKITEDGPVPIRDYVTEEYKITDKPIYNTVLYKEKTKESLVYGEHIDWTWMNEVWAGIKIGPSIPTYGVSSTTGFTPMYIGLNGGKPGRLPFQFKGDDELYGCKLPVEGCVFSDYNSHSRSVVDTLKPYQIGFNMAMNQAVDLMVDELGVIITFDPNALPKHSLGDDWGPDNFPKAWAFAKDHGVIPFNTAIASTEVPVNPNHFQKIDASQTERLMGRINLANQFKQMGMDAMGLNAQRVGTPIDQDQTATGVHQAVAASHSSTEHLYTQFDELMVRVHQQRTNLAQYYNSNNPSVRLQYTTGDGMKQWFEITGTELMGREFGVSCQSDSRTRYILNEMRQILLTNNTTGANMGEILTLVEADNIPEVKSIIKGIQNRQENEKNQQMGQEQQMHEQELEQAEKHHMEDQQFQAEQKDLDRKSNEYIAEIRASVATGAVDLNKNQQTDYLDTLQVLQGQQQHQDKINLEREKHITDTGLKKQELGIRQQEISAENSRTHAMLKVDRVNDRVKSKKKDKAK